MNDRLQRTYDLKRWERLRGEIRKAGEFGAAIEPEDFRFLLEHGFMLTEEDVSYIDNCYISRAEATSGHNGERQRVKTLTTRTGEFYVPF